MPSTKRLIKTMTPLFLGMSLLFVGNGLVVSSLSTLLKQMNVDELTIGLINSCFFIGALLSTIFAHIIVSKVGHIRSFAVFSAIFSVCSLLFEISQNLYFWAFLRVCLGFCYYALLMVIESWLNEKTRDKIRSKMLAFYECIFYISFAIGVLLLALNLKTTQIFIISTALIMLSSIPLNLIKIKEPKIPQKEPVSLPKIFGIAPLAIFCSVIAGILVSGFFSMASLFVMLQGFDVSKASYFIAVATIGGFISQFLMGSLSDKYGRRPAIIFSSVISLLASVLFLILGSNILIQYLLVFFLGSGVFCLYALALARANDILEHKSKTIEVGRALLFSYSFGSLIAPIIIGIIMKEFGYYGFIYVYVILLCALIIFALTQDTVPKEHRGQYQAHTIRTVIIDDINSEEDSQNR